jgi:hypothetical protein
MGSAQRLSSAKLHVPGWSDRFRALDKWRPGQSRGARRLQSAAGPAGDARALSQFRKSIRPSVVQTADGSVFKFELSFTGLDTGLLLPAVQKPNADGNTEFQFKLADGSVFVADLTFSGLGGVSSWVSFNPQPDPPGSPLGYFVGFAGDASVALQLSENGVPLSFMVPEPSTWALMGIGFATLGLLAYRKAGRTLTFPSQV